MLYLINNLSMNFNRFLKILSENTVNQEFKKIPIDYTISISANGQRSLDTNIKSAMEFYEKHIKEQISLISEDAAKNLAKWLVYRQYKNDNLSLRTIISIKDFLGYSIDNNGNFNPQLSSKFNDVKFSWGDLLELNDKYHSDLKKGNIRSPARAIPDPDTGLGKVILSFPDGYKWVDIEQPYCDVEARSMGHCGNAGRKRGDTILSLRDSRNIPYLTFILNDGKLGEMKGRQNDKPVPKYHKYIIELLILPIIKQVVGGGYMPENNFSLSQLKHSDLIQLLRIKPELPGSEYEVSQLLLHSRRPEEIIEAVGSDKILQYFGTNGVLWNYDKLISCISQSSNPHVIIKKLKLNKDSSFNSKLKYPDTVALLRDAYYPARVVTLIGLKKILEDFNYKLHKRIFKEKDIYHFIFNSKNTEELTQALSKQFIRKLILRLDVKDIAEYLENPEAYNVGFPKRTEKNIKYQLLLLKNYLSTDQINSRVQSEKAKHSYYGKDYIKPTSTIEERINTLLIKYQQD